MEAWRLYAASARHSTEHVPAFHVHRMTVDVDKIKQEVHRLLRRMSATEAQSRTLRRMVQESSVSIQPVQQVTTMIFIARQYTDENGLTYRRSFFHYSVAQSF